MTRKFADIGDIAYLLYSIVPFELLCALGRLRGRLQYHLDARARSTVRSNLLAVFGQQRSRQDIEAMTRQYFEYQQMNRFPILLAPALRDADLAKLVRIEGIHHLDQAIAQGKGAILLGSHLSSIFMLLAITVLRKRGYDVRVAMATPHDAWARTRLRAMLDGWTGRQTQRELIGGFYAQFNIRPIVRCIDEGAIVAQTGDGWHSAAFVNVEFLGRTMPFTTGMVRVAQVTGAPIVPLFADGEPPDRVRIILEEPFSVANDRARRQEVEMAVATYARRLEYYLVRNVPTWQHWEIPNMLDAIQSLPERTLRERYKIG